MTQTQPPNWPDFDLDHGTIKTHDGRTLETRLINVEDADHLVDFVRSLSPESRRRRFHQSIEHLSKKMIHDRAHDLADVDNYTQGGAVLALIQESDGTPHIIAVARLARVPGKPHDPQAEAAIVVRDDYQGQGVGTQLVRRLVVLARQMKVKEIIAYFESDNTVAIHLFRNLGLPSTLEISYGETTMLIEMPWQ